jgi:hypothetical protein
MIYQKKSIPVLVLRLADGKYRVTDIFGKVEELPPEDFARYVEMKSTSAPEASKAENVKELAQEITNAILVSDTDYAIDLLQRLL